MTSADLADKFVKMLLRDIGGSQRRWRAVMGKVKVYSTDTHAHCNWAIDPTGDAGENAAIERIADRLRGEYPIVSE